MLKELLTSVLNNASKYGDKPSEGPNGEIAQPSFAGAGTKPSGETSENLLNSLIDAESSRDVSRAQELLDLLNHWNIHAKH